MPEPFKNWFNEDLIHGMAKHFQQHWPAFDTDGFIHAASENLQSLELKARSTQIRDAMIKYLPTDFKAAGNILLASLGEASAEGISAGSIDDKGIAGWAVMPMADYVGLQGQNHFELSMHLLKEMTKCFTAEFAIRLFLLEAPDKTLSTLHGWTGDSNQHVRRLVSEGSRPRLPWAMQLPDFIADPAPVIALLEKLKDDDQEYVRRSVANNLNDIAKDHPDTVAAIAQKWLIDASPERAKLVRHACRTLVKNGHKKTLEILGYGPPKICQMSIEIDTPDVLFGEALQFSFTLQSNSNEEQALMLDYIIHHQKANGSSSPKVFKWRSTSLPANATLKSSKKHPMRKITTRRYYPGTHAVEVMVNGVSMCRTDFQLIMPG